ncbi:MAG: DUF3086 domain-containing protein, partial [Cyanobium sp.]
MTSSPEGTAAETSSGATEQPASPPAAPAPDPAPDTSAELLGDLLQKRSALLAEIRALEQQRDRVQGEIEANPLGRSERIAARVKGFQAYLVGALQELAASAEQAELVREPLRVEPSPLDRAAPPEPVQPPAAAGLFQNDEAQIRACLERYGGQPNFSADPWKLRRTLEPARATVLADWFLQQGGRGAQPSAGSRNRNVLVAAAAIAILGELYGDRFQTLVLAGQPERLGEWRRGLQDCLGLGREDFGPSSGIVLFERADALIERADRLEERGELPFILIDAAEDGVAIPVLQFPLWLAFAA